MRIIPRPRRHAHQKRHRRPAQPDIQRVVDILGDEAGEEGEEAGRGEQEGGEGFDEGLAVEVLLCGRGWLEGGGGRVLVRVKRAYDFAFPDCARLVQEGVELIHSQGRGVPVCLFSAFAADVLLRGVRSFG